MRSIVCHKVGIDEQNPELGRALKHADICIGASGDDVLRICVYVVLIMRPARG